MSDHNYHKNPDEFELPEMEDTDSSVSAEGMKAVIYGDSVTGDTIIRVDDRRVKIEDLFSHVDHTIGDKEYCNLDNRSTLTYHPEHHAVVSRPIKYVMRHKTSKTIYRVWINNTQWVDVTEDHSLIGYANTRYRSQHKCGTLVEVKPENIGVGKNSINSLIKLARVPYSPTSREHTNLEMELLGFIIGDGSLSKSDLSLSIGECDIPHMRKRLLDPLIECGLVTKYHTRSNGHDVRLAGKPVLGFVRTALYGDLNKKSIPDWIMNQPHESICAFLRGLFTADGTHTSQGSVRLTTVRDDIRHTVCELLHRVGVAHSSFRETNENAYKGVPSGTYSYHINIIARDKFFTDIGFMLPRKTHTPKKQSKKMTSVALGDDVTVARPLKIECLGEVNGYVYDIEVAETHMFFANDILVHNTDSAYLDVGQTMEDANLDPTDDEISVAFADFMADTINDQLPTLIATAFNTPLERANLLEAGREVVSSYRGGLFQEAKKRYAINVINNEGKPQINEDNPKGKIKTMGLEIARSDTPKWIQKELANFIALIIQDGGNPDDIWAAVRRFQKDFRDREMWTNGSPGRVKNLHVKTAEFKHWVKERESGFTNPKPPTLHYMVKAAMSTNLLIDEISDGSLNPIEDGDKVSMLYLLPNDLGIDSIAVPEGASKVPDWFQDLPFDKDRMEERLVTKKLENTFARVLQMDITKPESSIDDLEDDDSFY